MAMVVPAGLAPQFLRAAFGTGAFGSLGESDVVTVPTYESISIEVTGPAPTTSARAGQSGGCRIRYRREGANGWTSALDLPYDGGARNGVTAVLPAQYRGALVLLEPGTRYEIAVTHDDGSVHSFAARTRPDVERLPIARAVRLPDRGSPFEVTAGGSPAGYVLYEPAGGRRATVDAGRASDYCMRIDARAGAVSHIIFRNIRFTRALRHCVQLGSSEDRNREPIGDIIFDNCEFDGWASPGSPGCGFAGNLHSGLYCASSALQNVTVQGCHFHHPAYGANSWYPDEGLACRGTNHPEGPQCITFKGSIGGHVLRYNTFEAGPGVRFNDSMGETHNFSDGGFPAANCDIYRNIVRGVNDDGMEIEGRSQNIRLWENVFDDCFHGFGLAPVYRGPVYIWGNIGLRSRSGARRARGQNFLKWRRVETSADWSGGHVFVFNNSLLPPLDARNRGFKQLYAEFSARDSIRNWHVWNNVVYNDDPSPRPSVAFDDATGINNDIRNNVFAFGWRAPHELTPPSGNLAARAVYAINRWDPERGAGTFVLAPGPGFQSGLPVPGIYSEVRPDCGAQQHGRRQPVGYGHLNMPRGS